MRFIFSCLLLAIVLVWNLKDALGQQTPVAKPQSQEVERLKTQIQQSEQVLSQLRKQERLEESSGQNYDHQIALRIQLVNRYKQQIESLTAEQDSLNASLEGLRNYLANLRQTFKKRAIHLYKYGRMHDMALLLSAKSVNEFLIRVYYLRSFANQRDRQWARLQNAEQQLSVRYNAIQVLLNQNKGLLQAAENEQQAIERLKQERVQRILGYQQKRARLEEDLDLKSFYLRGLGQEIANTQTVTASAPVAQSSLAPVSRADLLDVAVKSPVVATGAGIEIEVPPNSIVKAGFAGTITRIFKQPGFGTCVALSVGSYTMIYGNLSSVSVSMGQEVGKGTVIGKSGTTGEPMGEKVFFAVYRGKYSLSPLAWLQ